MSASLKIALFVYSTKPRGGVIHTIELAEALHQLGHDVCVYALSKEQSGFHRHLSCRYNLVPTQPVTGNTDQLIHQRIQEFIDYLSDRPSEHLAYDCYHAQDCISANALAVLRQQKRIPHLIRTVHHIDQFNSPYLQDCQERSIREPDLCLCVSHHWQTELQRQYEIQALRVINGVNSNRFLKRLNETQQLRQQLGLIGQPVYLTVGGIEPRKNSIALLQAFSRVLDSYPDAQLVIAGGETLFDYQTYRDTFFALAHQHGIKVGKSLILPGVVSEQRLLELYQAADAFVFPSLKEGWGLVVLEAIASGLPVITSNQPPFTEFLTAQQALLIDPTVSDAIAQAMLSVVKPEVAQPLLQNSRSVCSEYTWEKSAKMHLEHYQKLQKSL